MPVSTESTTTEVRETTAPPIRHYWNLFACDGPADLYRGFAVDAVDEFLKPYGNIEEEQFALMLDAIDVAVSTVLNAANVPTSWLPQYEAATAHLKGAQ